MWLRTFFIVRQWGSEQVLTSPLACSRRWHLCAWSNRTSCCWMSLRFSGSAVGPAETPPAPGTMPTEPTCCCSWGCKKKKKTQFNQIQRWIPFIISGFWPKNTRETGNYSHDRYVYWYVILKKDTCCMIKQSVQDCFGLSLPSVKLCLEIKT